MSKFIEVTANDMSDTKMILNTDHIIAVTPDGFSGMTRIMIPGAMIEIKNSYLEIQQLLNPN